MNDATSRNESAFDQVHAMERAAQTMARAQAVYVGDTGDTTSPDGGTDMPNEQPETIEHKVDRNGWARGPWDDEPDREHWIDDETGLDCLVVRNSMGAWCGYVGLPEGHPQYRKHYDEVYVDLDIDVHGGLTYAHTCRPPICHTAAEAAHEPVWWVGFDCLHLGDDAPGRSFRAAAFGHEEYRDIDYVRGEVTKLARQLRAI